MLRQVRKPKKAASQKCEVAFYGNWKVMRAMSRVTFYLLRILHNIFVLHQIIDQGHYSEDQCDPHNDVCKDL